MTIFKKLLLMTIFLGANFGFIGANYFIYAQDRQSVFDFAARLEHGASQDQCGLIKYDKISSENKELAEWLKSELNNDSLSEQAVLIINSYSLTDEQKIAMLQKMKPTTFKKYSTYIYSKTKKGLTNIAKFTVALTAGLAAVAILPGLVTCSETIGRHVGNDLISYMTRS